MPAGRRRPPGHRARPAGGPRRSAPAGDPAGRCATASVIGRTAPAPRCSRRSWTCRASGSEDALRHAVDRARAARPTATGCTFRHALLQEAVAASLLPGEAARTAPTDRRGAHPGPRRSPAAGTRRRRSDGPALGRPPATRRPAALGLGRRRPWRRCDALAFAESLVPLRAGARAGRRGPGRRRRSSTCRGARLLYWAPPRSPTWPRTRTAPPSSSARRSRAWTPTTCTCTRCAARTAGPLPLDGGGRPSAPLASYQRARSSSCRRSRPTRWRAAVLSGLLADADARRPVRRVRGRWPREAIAVAAQVPDGAVRRGARAVQPRRRPRATSAELDGGHRRAAARPDRSPRSSSTTSTTSPGPWSTCTSILLDAGRLDEARRGRARRASSRPRRWVSQRRKGVWSRCDAAEVLILLGRLDEAGTLLDEARELRPSGHRRVPDRPRGRPAAGCAGATSTGRAPDANAPSRPASADHRPARCVGPLYATPGRDRRPGRATTWPRRRWSEDGLSRLDRCVHAAHVATGSCRSRDGGCPGRPAAADRSPALLDRVTALLAASPAPGTPAEVEVRRGRGRAVRRRDSLAGRGRPPGRTRRALPRRRTPGCGWPRRC